MSYVINSFIEVEYNNNDENVFIFNINIPYSDFVVELFSNKKGIPSNMNWEKKEEYSDNIDRIIYSSWFTLEEVNRFYVDCRKYDINIAIESIMIAMEILINNNRKPIFVFWVERY